MKVIRTILILLLTAGLLAGCTRNPVQVSINAEQDGDSIELRVGDTLVIELPVNPTEGHIWEVADIDASILRPEQSEGQPSPESGTTAILKFSAAGPGTTNLKLVYSFVTQQRETSKESFNEALSSSGAQPAPIGHNIQPLDYFDLTVVVK